MAESSSQLPSEVFVGIGIELDPVRAAVARQNVAAAGVSDLVTIEVGDALDFDMGRITVATTYLYPPLLAKLSHSLKGLRFVASPFHPVPCLPMFSDRRCLVLRICWRT
jgi:predicted RNA methylase